MKTIYKYTLEITDAQCLQLPAGFKVLKIEAVDDKPRMWCLVDPHAVLVDRKIMTYGTGREMPDRPGKYLGSYLVLRGRGVFHVFMSKDREDQR